MNSVQPPSAGVTIDASKIKKEQGCLWNKSKYQVNFACGLRAFFEIDMSTFHDELS